jgi:hypothetical protein
VTWPQTRRFTSGSRLQRLTCDLAMLTAWCSYDVEQHEHARRLWTVAFALCRHTAHPQAADLAVGIVLDMAHQAVHLNRPDEALQLVGRGLVVENNSPAAVSDAARSYLASVQGWSYAMLGRLHMLDDCLALHQTADVAELRHNIQSACAAL